MKICGYFCSLDLFVIIWKGFIVFSRTSVSGSLILSVCSSASRPPPVLLCLLPHPFPSPAPPVLLCPSSASPLYCPGLATYTGPWMRIASCSKLLYCPVPARFTGPSDAAGIIYPPALTSFRRLDVWTFGHLDAWTFRRLDV